MVITLDELLNRGEAVRMTTLLLRLRRSAYYRIVPPLLMMVFTFLMMSGVAYWLGHWPTWLTVCTIIAGLFSGLLGEAWGRILQESNANDVEVAFARSLIWAIDDKDERQLHFWIERDSAFTYRWLQLLAEYSPNNRFVEQARSLLAQLGPDAFKVVRA